MEAKSGSFGTSLNRGVDFFLLRGFNFFSGFGFSMGGNTMTVSRVVNLVSHLRHIRNLVLPLGKSLGLVGKTFSSVDLQFGQVSMI